MTEFTRARSVYIYRINPDVPTQIDVKENKPRARWRLFKRCGASMQAVTELLRAEFAQRDATGVFEVIDQERLEP